MFHLYIHMQYVFTTFLVLLHGTLSLKNNSYSKHTSQFILSISNTTNITLNYLLFR